MHGVGRFKLYFTGTRFFSVADWMNFAKAEFWDVFRLRYGFTLKRLLSYYKCSKPYTIQHANLVKTVELWPQDNEVRDIIAEMLDEVTHYVKVERSLPLLIHEELKGNFSHEARSYVNARGFWSREQRALIDIMIFYPNA